MITILENTNESLIVRVPLSTVLKYCNPIKQICWVGLDKPITKKEVLDFHKLNPNLVELCVYENLNRADHIHKIAYFLQNEILSPLQIDTGFMSYVPNWLVCDGNHRLFSIILKKEKFVDIAISGSIDEAIKKGFLPKTF